MVPLSHADDSLCPTKAFAPMAGLSRPNPARFGAPLEINHPGEGTAGAMTAHPGRWEVCQDEVRGTFAQAKKSADPSPSLVDLIPESSDHAEAAIRTRRGAERAF
jgi:hypothetical protein